MSSRSGWSRFPCRSGEGRVKVDSARDPASWRSCIPQQTLMGSSGGHSWRAAPLLEGCPADYRLWVRTATPGWEGGTVRTLWTLKISQPMSASKTKPHVEENCWDSIQIEHGDNGTEEAGGRMEAGNRASRQKWHHIFQHLWEERAQRHAGKWTKWCMPWYGRQRCL